MNKKKKGPIKPIKDEFIPQRMKDERTILQNLSHFSVSEEMTDLEFRLYCLTSLWQWANKEGEILKVEEIKERLLILKNNQIIRGFDKFHELGCMKAAE